MRKPTVARLTKEIARLDSALAEPGLFARDPAKAAAFAKARADHAAALATGRGGLAGGECRRRGRDGDL